MDSTAPDAPKWCPCTLLVELIMSWPPADLRAWSPKTALIATVSAMHSNGVDPEYFGGELGRAMKEAGLAGDVGLATGYVLRFSNGLVAWLSAMPVPAHLAQDLMPPKHRARRLPLVRAPELDASLSISQACGSRERCAP